MPHPTTNWLPSYQRPPNPLPTGQYWVGTASKVGNIISMPTLYTVTRARPPTPSPARPAPPPRRLPMPTTPIRPDLIRAAMPPRIAPVPQRPMAVPRPPTPAYRPPTPSVVPRVLPSHRPRVYIPPFRPPAAVFPRLVKTPPARPDDHRFFEDLVRANDSWTEPVGRDEAERLRSRWAFRVREATPPNDVVENVKLGLDAAGLVPGIGEIADGFSALISLLQGKFGEAAFSAAATVPIWGSAATIAKWELKYGKAAVIGMRHLTLSQLLEQSRRLTRTEKLAARDAAKEYNFWRNTMGVGAQEAASKAGTAYHDAIGAAGPGKGVDLFRPGAIKEVKTHYGPMEKWHIHAAEAQGQRYLDKHHRTRGLTPIRLTEHVYIDPTTGAAVKFVF